MMKLNLAENTGKFLNRQAIWTQVEKGHIGVARLAAESRGKGAKVRDFDLVVAASSQFLLEPITERKDLVLPGSRGSQRGLEFVDVLCDGLMDSAQLCSTLSRIPM
jgi:hypothetical protein